MAMTADDEPADATLNFEKLFQCAYFHAHHPVQFSFRNQSYLVICNVRAHNTTVSNNQE